MEEDDTAELHVLPRRAEMWEASSRSLGKQWKEENDKTAGLGKAGTSDLGQGAIYF